MYSFCTQAQIITTIAGTGIATFGGDGGPASAASIYVPNGISLDLCGDIIFSDEYNIRIRKIDTSGRITTIAGNGTRGYAADGTAATSAEIYGTVGLFVDTAGNVLFNDDAYLRHIDILGLLGTLAGTGTIGFSGDGGPATNAGIDGAEAMTMDRNGDLYFADGYRVRRVDAITDIVNTIAGNGVSGYTGDNIEATATELNRPTDLSIDATGNIYIADLSNYRLRKVDSTGIITTIAGTGSYGLSTGDGGPATAATFEYPAHIAMDSIGNIYISDGNANVVRKIDRDGIIHAYAGNNIAAHTGDGGPATAASINGPAGLCVDRYGNMYISEAGGNYIRKITTNNNLPSFVNGRNQALSACVADTTFIDSLMPVTDPDVGQTETWTLTYGPLHGTAAAAYSALSTGSTLTPSGLWYSSATGYSGADTFSVRIDDGYSVYTTTVYVNVRLCPLLAAAVDDKQEAVVFPDPSDGSFSIRPFSNTATGITITNMIGQKVYCTTIDRTTDIHLGVPAGLYIIDASGADGRHSVMKLSIR